MCEYAEVHNTVERKARKVHKCLECKVQINPGDRYWYSSGIFDHEPFSEKRCGECHDLYNFLWALPETDCIDTNLHEHLVDCDYIACQPHDEEDEHGSYCTITPAVPWLRCFEGRWVLNREYLGQ
jgi:hypothetical protein